MIIISYLFKIKEYAPKMCVELFPLERYLLNGAELYTRFYIRMILMSRLSRQRENLGYTTFLIE